MTVRIVDFGLIREAKERRKEQLWQEDFVFLTVVNLSSLHGKKA